MFERYSFVAITTTNLERARRFWVDQLGFRVTEERGKFMPSPFAPYVMATIHPSALLRIEDEADKRAKYREFVKDLKAAARLVFKSAA